MSERQHAIAEAWFEVLAPTGYVPLSPKQIVRSLDGLVGRAVDLLLVEPSDAGAAESLGEAVASLHYLQPEALGETLAVFARELVAGLPLEWTFVLQPRLTALLIGLAVGFHREAQTRVLTEQEAVRSAFLTALSDAEQSLRAAHNELELRVQERTAELAQSNEELRLEIQRRKRVEAALRLSEEKYRNLVENVSDVIFTLDGEGRLTYASPALASALGYEASEVRGHHLSELVATEDLLRMTRAFQHLVAGQPIDSEYRVRAKSGDLRWVRIASQPVFELGQVVGFQGILTDVTERKLAEEALRESEERWRSLVENAPDAVLIVDQMGQVLFINRSPPGTDTKPTLGQSVFDYVWPDHHSVVRESLARVFRTGEPDLHEVIVQDRGRGRVWYSTRVGPIWRGDEVVSALLIARDVTGRKKLEELKDNLIRDVSHELRTPLAKMEMSLAYLMELMEQDDIDRRRAVRTARMAHGSVQRLKQTVGGILDLSSLEAGVANYQLESLNPADLIRTVVQEMEPLAQAKGLALKVNLPDRLPQVVGDWEKLFRVLTNLMDNAIKFSDEGEIVVSAVDGGQEVEIAVRDRGQGIQEEHCQLIFERFYQEKSRFPGIGVGLAICQTIVKAHGGEIWAESPGRGQGATLHFTLPVAEVAVT